LIAITGSYQFAPKWALRFYGDIGTGDSDLTWQTHLSVGYQATDSLVVLLGARQVGYEMQHDNASLDLSICRSSARCRLYLLKTNKKGNAESLSIAF
ncbi:hypothetical protein ACFPTZ_26335, partial [Rubritalea tangerina]